MQQTPKAGDIFRTKKIVGWIRTEVVLEACGGAVEYLTCYKWVAGSSPMHWKLCAVSLSMILYPLLSTGSTKETS